MAQCVCRQLRSPCLVSFRFLSFLYICYGKYLEVEQLRLQLNSTDLLSDGLKTGSSTRVRTERCFRWWLLMAFEPLVWYCQPAANVAWEKMVDGAFGAYTPCAINSVVISISYLVFLGLCCYRIFLIKKNSKVQRFSLRSKCYSYMLCLLAGYCTMEPLLRLFMGISIFNLNGETGLAPYEATSSIIEATAWCSVLIMIGLETKCYICEFQWCVRFGIVYVLLGNAVLLNLVLPVKDLYSSYALYLSIGTFFCKVLFGILLLVHFPNLHPCLGYTLVPSKSSDDEEYELLSGTEQIFPERHASIISSSDLAELVKKQPVSWSVVQCENSLSEGWYPWSMLLGIGTSVRAGFHKCWAKETQRSKPRLLRALNGSLGRRFWWGGVVKVVFISCQYTGPIFLNHLLQSIQHGDPAWIGYTYAFLMFLGVLCVALLEAHYVQIIWRVGFRVRSTLVAAIFHKSLRLNHEVRKNFPSGKIMNMITTDVNAIEGVCKQLHVMWSAPFSIINAMVLLYQQLGVASLFGSLILVLNVPLQVKQVSTLY
ncbi:hypothetical protein V6N13_041566 [Hibiscus sabdariffa]